MLIFDTPFLLDQSGFFSTIVRFKVESSRFYTTFTVRGIINNNELEFTLFEDSFNSESCLNFEGITIYRATKRIQ